MKKITIVVPCYNEEKVIPIFFEEVKKVFSNLYEYRIVFIDDGSNDNTFSVIKDLAIKNDFVSYGKLSKNFGKEAAMLAGLKLAKKLESDAAIIMDVDLQDPPYLIPKMLEQYEKGFKHVMCKHKNRNGESIFKTICAFFFYRIYALLTHGKIMARGSRDYCLLDKAVIDAFLEIKDYNRFTKGIFTEVGFNKYTIVFDYEKRAAGKTKWSFIKLFKYALMGINQFSHFLLTIPLVSFLIVLGVMIFDIVYPLVNNFKIDFNMIKLEGFILLVIASIYTLMWLLYDVREQARNKPIYFLDETNVKD